MKLRNKILFPLLFVFIILFIIVINSQLDFLPRKININIINKINTIINETKTNIIINETKIIKKTNCIVYIAPDSKRMFFTGNVYRIELLANSLSKLYKFYNKIFKNDVFILHENYSSKEKDFLQSFVPQMKLHFIEIKLLNINSNNCTLDQVTRWSKGLDGGIPDGRNLGYRFVQKLWMFEIPQMPEFENYEYLTRFDDDSFLFNNINIDFGTYSKMHNKTYVVRTYVGSVPDRVSYPNNFFPFILDHKEYFNVNSKSDIIDRWIGCNVGDRSTYYNGNYAYNNYFTMKLSIARSKVFREFVKKFECVSLKLLWNEGVVQPLMIGATSKIGQCGCVNYFEYAHNFHWVSSGSCGLGFSMDSKYTKNVFKEIYTYNPRWKI